MGHFEEGRQVAERLFRTQISTHQPAHDDDLKKMFHIFSMVFTAVESCDILARVNLKWVFSGQQDIFPEKKWAFYQLTLVQTGLQAKFELSHNSLSLHDHL